MTEPASYTRNERPSSSEKDFVSTNMGSTSSGASTQEVCDLLLYSMPFYALFTNKPTYITRYYSPLPEKSDLASLAVYVSTPISRSSPSSTISTPTNPNVATITFAMKGMGKPTIVFDNGYEMPVHAFKLLSCSKVFQTQDGRTYMWKWDSMNCYKNDLTLYLVENSAVSNVIDESEYEEPNTDSDSIDNTKKEKETQIHTSEHDIKRHSTNAPVENKKAPVIEVAKMKRVPGKWGCFNDISPRRLTFNTKLVSEEVVVASALVMLRKIKERKRVQAWAGSGAAAGAVSG